jgi:hypothetical protein
MAIDCVRCPVLGFDVTKVTNLEGEVVRVICSEYQEADGGCRAKNRIREGGPLAQLLERVSEHALDTRSSRCVLLA